MPAAIQVLDKDMYGQLPPTELLNRKLDQHRCINFQGKLFLPNSSLHAVLDQTAFRELLELLKYRGRESTIHDASRSFVKILAILNYMGRAEDIFSFVNRCIDDSYLPMPCPTGSNDSLPIPWAAVTTGWRKYQLHAFYHYQWSVNVPSFQWTNKGPYSVDNRNREDPDSFHPNTVLPFMSSELLESHGGFRNCRVRIHPDYINSGPNQMRDRERQFILKSTNRASDLQSRNLQKDLTSFAGSLVAAFTTHEGLQTNYYLLFLWIDECLSPSEFSKTVASVSSALRKAGIKFGINGGAGISILRQGRGLHARLTQDIDVVVQPTKRYPSAQAVKDFLVKEYPTRFTQTIYPGDTISTVVFHGARLPIGIDILDHFSWKMIPAYDLRRRDNTVTTVIVLGVKIPVFRPDWQIKRKKESAYDRRGMSKGDVDLDDILALFEIVSDLSACFNPNKKKDRFVWRALWRTKPGTGSISPSSHVKFGHEFSLLKRCLHVGSQSWAHVWTSRACRWPDQTYKR